MDEVEWGNEPFKLGDSVGDEETEGEDPFKDDRKEDPRTDEQEDKEDNPEKELEEKSITKDASIDNSTGGEGTASSAFSPTKVEKPKVKDKKKPEKEVHEEYKGYSDYLDNTFSKLKKTILKTVEVELFDKTGKHKYKKKSFSEFIRKMTNAFFKTTFSDKFYNNIEKYIKKDLKLGVKEAEEALGKAITIKNIDNEALLLTQQQIDGYTMYDGKKFVGIKGATQEVEKQLINNLNEAISKEDVTMEDLTKAVEDAWTGREGIDENRTLRIARTESNRIVNKGKLQGAIESGMDVKKKWDSYPEDCPICDKLSKQPSIELNEWFEHEDNKFQTPPAHSNCRCSISLVT